MYFMGCFQNDDYDSDSEDEESLKAMVSTGSHSFANCLRCFCRPYVLSFTCGTILVSFVCGCVLWELGLLQPILAQCMVYLYVVGIVATFLALLVYQVWMLVARSVRVVLSRLHPLAKAKRDLAKHRFLDFCDDGEMHPTAGEIQWRSTLWNATHGPGRDRKPRWSAFP